jgi:hypothetical protein
MRLASVISSVLLLLVLAPAPVGAASPARISFDCTQQFDRIVDEGTAWEKSGATWYAYHVRGSSAYWSTFGVGQPVCAGTTLVVADGDLLWLEGRDFPVGLIRLTNHLTLTAYAGGFDYSCTLTLEQSPGLSSSGPCVGKGFGHFNGWAYSAWAQRWSDPTTGGEYSRVTGQISMPRR